MSNCFSLNIKSTHVAPDCRRCRFPETQIYTDSQHLVCSQPHCDTDGTPLGWSLDRQTDKETDGQADERLIDSKLLKAGFSYWKQVNLTK